MRVPVAAIGVRWALDLEVNISYTQRDQDTAVWPGRAV